MRVAFLIGITLLGFAAGRKLKIDPKGIASLLIYVISPFVIFLLIMNSSAQLSYLYFTLVTFLFGCVMAFLALHLGKIFFKDTRAHLLSFASGTGNVSYFGIPLIMGLFDNNSLAVVVFIVIGINLYEFSYGFYITCCGKHSIKKSMKKISRLPIIYAAMAGMLLKFLGVEIHEILASGLEYFKGAYSVLGMMVIGMTLGKFRKFEIDWKFTGMAILWKHLIFPLCAMGLIWFFLGSNWEYFFLLVLVTSMPMAVNTVVVANELAVHPEKAAFSVVLSTLFSIVTMPCVVYFVHLASGVHS